MNLSPVFLMHLKNTTDRILHVPGNFTGPVLEMAVVIDACLKREQVSEYLPAILKTLKMHSEVFRNVRLNIVCWNADGLIETKVCPMSMVMLASFYKDYKQNAVTKTFEGLVDYLKMYQARSKLIILLTDGAYQVEHEELLGQVMQPFLNKKMMQGVFHDGEAELHYRFTRIV